LLLGRARGKAVDSFWRDASPPPCVRPVPALTNADRTAAYHARQNWIPLAVAWPIEGAMVLVRFTDNRVAIGYWWAERGIWWHRHGTEPGEPTAWAATESGMAYKVG